MNYIESYYGAIESGKVVTSEKIRRTYKHLVAKMHVAPFMGAWIEITWRLRLVRILTSLTFHGKKEC